MDINSLEEKIGVKSKATEDFWKEVDKHPAFSSGVDPGGELSPELAGLQALKFESEDPVANATSYKDEGNHHYQKKQFKLAIDNYTAAIKINPPDPHLNAVLYTNRAIANFYLGNYRSCIADCNVAVRFNPKHTKALLRGAHASLALNKSDECLRFCVEGLKIDPGNKELSDLQLKAMRQEVQKEKDAVAKSTAIYKSQLQADKLRKMVRSRGIQICDTLPPVEIPDNSDAVMYTDEEGNLHWPVLLLYFEFGQSDFLRDVVETSSITDCLKLVFNPCEPAPSWDPHRVYTVSDDSLVVYYENVTGSGGRVVTVDKMTSIRELTHQKEFALGTDLVIVLHVVSKSSTKFYAQWRRAVCV